ncbi:hypothetical protein Tco_1156708, partial [Tanacetum coccineum]
MIDYALWEVIENGATLQKTQVVEGATTVMPITSAEDKERIPKKKTKNEAKTTKPDTEWKSVEKDKVKSKPKNKADLDTMSMDDLYNNLKVYEPEVKGISSAV